MWFQLSALHIIASAVLLPASQAFTVSPTNDANALAGAIFGEGITILQASFSGAAISSGIFNDGPFGIGTGAILTSGAVVGALPNGDHYVDNGAPGSSVYCGPNTFNAAILTADILIDPSFSGVRVQAILASEEEGGSADPIGIFLGNTQYAVTNGRRITAVNPFLASPLVIRPPNSVTSYPGSSPPFWIDIFASGPQTMVIAICDQSDSEWDSGLLVNIEGCTDCDTDVRFAYVTTTTTLAPGEAPFTSTTTASGTVSGTVRIGVVAEETPTTTADETTTDFAEATTTPAGETTIATAEETPASLAETTTTMADETTLATVEETPTTTTDETATTLAEMITTSTSSHETTISIAKETTTTTASDTTTTTAIENTTTKESTIATSSDKATTTTAQGTTTPGTTELSTESSTTVIFSEELPGTTTTADLATSDTTTESSIIATESTTGAPIFDTTTTSDYVEIPSTSSTLSATAGEITETLSSHISTLDTAAPSTSVTTTVEFLGTTTTQETGSSTDLVTLSFTQSAEVTSSLAITSTVEDVPTSESSKIVTSSANSAITIEPSVPVTRSQGGNPYIPPPQPSSVFNNGNSTRTEAILPITTTMTYTVVDPNNPSRLTVTEFCTTLRSPPCRQCQYQKPPTVAMTTIKVACNACGHYGENTIILDVPVGAIKAAPTGGHSGYQADHHEPSPHGQKPRPIDDGEYRFYHPQVHQGGPSDDHHSHDDNKPTEVIKTEASPKTGGDDARPEPAKPYESDEVDQPQTYHLQPTGAGYSHQKSETQIEPEPKLMGGNNQTGPMKPTFQRRPGPASTPAVPSAPIVAVSGASSRIWEGKFLSTLFMTGLAFILGGIVS